MTDEKTAVADTGALLKKAEEHIQKLTIELKEKEAEAAHYLEENAFLKLVLKRIVGANK